MGNPLVTLLVWVFYFGLTAATIVVDGKMQRAKVQAAGGVDFMDRSPWGYIVLGLVCGPLPLIFYFGSTRRSAAGYLVGTGAAVAVYVATVMAAVVLGAVFR